MQGGSRHQVPQLQENWRPRDEGDHADVTPCKVTTAYKFPNTELEAMADNMGKLINEIENLDVYRRDLMDELHQLRDIKLFYDNGQDDHQHNNNKTTHTTTRRAKRREADKTDPRRMTDTYIDKGDEQNI